MIEYDTFYLFPIDIYVDWLQFGDTKSNVVMNWSFGAHRETLLLDKYLQVELLGQGVYTVLCRGLSHFIIFLLLVTR